MSSYDEPKAPHLDLSDKADLARALRRAVFTHKLLTLDEAHRYCDLVGLPRSVLVER